ncbi:MAG: hypothetical protein ACRDL7_12540, partial [Gaiellaceae bacterium]
GDVTATEVVASMRVKGCMVAEALRCGGAIKDGIPDGKAKEGAKVSRVEEVGRNSAGKGCKGEGGKVILKGWEGQTICCTEGRSQLE